MNFIFKRINLSESSNYLALTGFAIRERCLIKIRFEHLGHFTPGSNLNSLGVISFLHLWQIYLVIVFHFLSLFLIFSVLTIFHSSKSKNSWNSESPSINSPKATSKSSNGNLI